MHPRLQYPRTRRGAGAVITILLIAGVLAGCAHDKGSASGSIPTNSTGTAAIVKEAQAAIARASARYGTAQLPDATPRPAAKDKTIAVIPNGMNNQSTAAQVNGVLEACKAIGWRCLVLDGKSDPTTYAGLVRQAIAEKVDGIILSGIDCSSVAQPLSEAKSAGIPIVGDQAFDCDLDGGTPMFSGSELDPNPQDPNGKPIDFKSYIQSFGRMRADAVIAGTNAHINLIAITNTEAAVLKVQYSGFKSEIERVPGAVISETQMRFTDLGPKLEALGTSALLRNPQANALESPFDAVLTSGVASAIVKSGRSSSLFVMGTEGIPAGLDLVRQGVIGAEMYDPASWHGWAAIDVMNSVLTHTPIVNSGAGLLYVDKNHNLPGTPGTGIPDSAFPDFRSVYQKAWGVS
jgi:ribose transport system substrate-binding protein